MALSAARTALYLVGVALMLAALYVFLFQSGLNKWIPSSLLAAGFLLVIGLALMGFASEAPSERTGHHHEHEDDEGDVTIVNR